jgi:hypothetical protein
MPFFAGMSHGFGSSHSFSLAPYLNGAKKRGQSSFALYFLFLLGMKKEMKGRRWKRRRRRIK